MRRYSYKITHVQEFPAADLPKREHYSLHSLARMEVDIAPTINVRLTKFYRLMKPTSTYRTKSIHRIAECRQ